MRLVAALALVAFFLSACGGSADPRPTVTPAAQDAGTPLATPTLQSCPIAERSVCDLARTLSRALEANDLSPLFAALSFAPQRCAPPDAGVVAAAEIARLPACYFAVRGFPSSCRADDTSSACTIDTTMVHMCSCGLTQGNVRYLTRDQYAQHLLPGARVTGVVERMPFGDPKDDAVREGPFIIFSSSPRPIPEPYGWSNMAEQWALDVDAGTLRVTGTYAFITASHSYFGLAAPHPFPADEVVVPEPTATPGAVATPPLASPAPPGDASVECGSGDTPEAAIGRCGFTPYAGDCDEPGHAAEAFCSAWVQSQGDLRLYSLAAPPDGLGYVTLAHDGVWTARKSSCTARVSTSTPDVLCRPAPFQAARAEYYVSSQNSNGRTEFGAAAVDLLADGTTVVLHLYFRNIGTAPVAWTSDVGDNTIFLEDAAGNRYPSIAVGGHFAEDMPALRGGEMRFGWHEFHIPQPAQALTLHYQSREPLAIDLSGRPAMTASN